MPLSSPSSPAPNAAPNPGSGRLPDPRWRPLRTLRFALVVALGFTLLTFALSAGNPSWESPAGWVRTGGTSLVFALIISFTIETLYLIGRRLLGTRIERMPRWRRTLYYWTVPMAGLAIALPLASVITGAITGASRDAAGGPQLRTTPLGAAAFMLLVMAIFYGYFAIRVRQQRAERQAVEAQLKLLQGQIEPHFLFNTLANVVGLMEVDTPRAKLMLESFVDYLRSSLGGLRRERHTLGDEIDLVDAYLRVIAIRMESRLRYTIDVPESLRSLELPALTLQPLVENAVLHGLEPKIDGGSIRIEARLDERRAGARLLLSVVDDGLGLPAADAAARRPTVNGTGTALANIRERLMQSHGADAELRVEPAAPHGVRATLTLPAREPLPIAA